MIAENYVCYVTWCFKYAWLVSRWRLMMPLIFEYLVVWQRRQPKLRATRKNYPRKPRNTKENYSFTRRHCSCFVMARIVWDGPKVLRPFVTLNKIVFTWVHKQRFQTFIQFPVHLVKIAKCHRTLHLVTLNHSWLVKYPSVLTTSTHSFYLQPPKCYFSLKTLKARGVT